MIRGALAAALTPLRNGGAALDEDAFPPYVDFLLGGGVAGILALGTTGEGISLSVPERRRATALLAGAMAGRGAVIAHCGAQTTADTVELASRAEADGADAVAVIAPPYYKLDDAAARERARQQRRRPPPLRHRQRDPLAGRPEREDPGDAPREEEVDIGRERVLVEGRTAVPERRQRRGQSSPDHARDPSP